MYPFMCPLCFEHYWRFMLPSNSIITDLCEILYCGMRFPFANTSKSAAHCFIHHDVTTADLCLCDQKRNRTESLAAPFLESLSLAAFSNPLMVGCTHKSSRPCPVLS